MNENINEKIKKSLSNTEEKILSDINRLENQLSLLRKLKIETIDIKTWNEICETPLRNDKILIDIIKAKFPMGYNFILKPSGVCFKIDGIDIKIPTDRNSAITIDMSWYIHGNFKPYILNHHSQIREYFKVLEDSNSTWYDLAKARRKSAFENPSKLELFIWWYTKGKWRKIEDEHWKYRLLIEDQENKNNISRYNLKINESNNKLRKLKNNILPTLTQFTEVKGYVGGKWLNKEELNQLEEFVSEYRNY